MPNILYVYQKQEQKIKNIHWNIKYWNTLKVWGKEILKDEFTGNPIWGQNVINKVKFMIFVTALAFKRRFKVWFVMFQVNEYVLYFIHLTFCADKVKIFR